MTQHVDIAIIGGGIQGAGIAQAAAASGFSTLIVEKNTWGSGTSSKSSKLIHGGLRYLQHGQFNLVRESLREREILLRIAPELVQRKDFYIPVYRNSHISPFALRAGLSLYWLLAGGISAAKYHNLKDEFSEQMAPLNTEGLTHLFCYSDAQTDDQLLTLAVIESAQSFGAHCYSECECLSAIKTRRGFRLYLRSKGGEQTVECRYLINASGPWAMELQHHIETPLKLGDFQLVQGTHLVFDQPLSPYCFYLEAPQDRRAVFALPWHQGTLLGTTETLHEGNPDQCRPIEQEQRYLMEVLHHYFPSWSAQPQSAFAGLRVLPKDNHKHPFSRSREVNILQEGNYLAVLGGKLTTYRSTAEKVVRKIAAALDWPNPIANTAEITLQAPSRPTDSSPLANCGNGSV